jgi:hypothetical protein
MIKIENIDVYGFESSIRGMRNPMNSWDKSDSYEAYYQTDKIIEDDIVCCPEYLVGENDLDLMKRLFKGGTEHRKYLRFINVTMDITAPLYWWKEFDTYKVGTNCNSCSTMHKIHAKEFTLDDFSLEHCEMLTKDVFIQHIIPILNIYRKLYCGIESGDRKGQKSDWWQMIQLLPTSYNQKRTVQMNYEVAVRMIQQRKNHKLDEWNIMVEKLLKLPYMKEIMGYE